MSGKTQEEIEQFIAAAKGTMARIESQRNEIVTARNRFISGKAAREEVFLALSTAATNMTLFLGVYQQSTMIAARFSAFGAKDFDIDKLLEGLEHPEKQRRDKGPGPRKNNIVPFPLSVADYREVEKINKTAP